MTHALRLHRGDDLLESIRAYAAAHDIAAAAIVSGVGCVYHAVIRDASGVNTHTLSGRYEIVSMTGTVSKARTHLHIALAGEDLRVIGGHLCPGTLVNTTCEIVLLELDGVRFCKEYDPQTGYNELEIKYI
ncbi:MAG: DNA-binding protein [Clostridiales bacterium]|nr:DNA-binding protein [Clostridiales bacterium]